MSDNALSIKTLIAQTTALISQKNERAIEQFKNSIDSLPNEAGSVLAEKKQREEESNLKQSVVHEKILEIDMIESDYMPNQNQLLQPVEEASSKPPVQQQPGNANQSQAAKPNPNRESVSNYDEEKKKILEEIRKLDDQIAEIKGETVGEDLLLKRKQKIMEEEQARKNANKLIKQLKNQKKQIEQRKKKQREKLLQNLQVEEQRTRKIREQEQARQKQEKRQAIEKRMEEQRRRREERLLIDKQSNQLIVQLRKEEEFEKETGSGVAVQSVLAENKNKKKAKHGIDLEEIEEHERRYKESKEAITQQRRELKERSTSKAYQAPKFQKNVWSEQLQEEEFKKKEEEKIREMHRKDQLQKRLKYGELVNNIFLPKKREGHHTPHQKIDSEQDQFKREVTPPPRTADKHGHGHGVGQGQATESVLPKIHRSEKRVGLEGKSKFNDQTASVTAHDYKKSKVLREAKEESEDQEKVKQEKLREAEIRRQTNDRLRKMENKSIKIEQKSKPKYENYLGHIKLKKENADDWKKIFDDDKLTQQEKYAEMLKKAVSMENKAKMKEEMRREGDQDAVDLYIGSIQAKLALLEKF